MTVLRFTPAFRSLVHSCPGAALVALMAAAWLVAPGRSPALAQPNVTGRWTQPTDLGADWGHNQIHLALMRGSGTSPHSYLWTWQSGTALGLRGWNPGPWDPQNPGLSDGTTYPAASFPVVSNPPEPGVDLFCSGHCFLSDGKLLVAGGTEIPGYAGITASRIFDPSNLTWTDPGSMAQRRWYPTLTQLPSGTQVLSTAGHSFDHSLAYGGTQDPTSPTSTTRGEVQRFQLTLAGQWDGHGNQTGASLPDPREGHTAITLAISSPPAMVMYGGRTTGGGLKADVWMMTPQQTDTGENYAWSQLTPSGLDPPGLRVRHTAIARPSDNSMIVFGGRNELSQTEDKVHRLWRDGLLWKWDLLSPSGTAPKRWGHAAVYDAANNRMLVFGGRDETDALAGTAVHALSLGASPAWSTPTVTNAAPAARDGHTMVVDPTQYTRIGVAWKRILVFGGHDGSSRKNDVWNLWIRVGDGQLEWQPANVQSCPSVCAPARTRHAALWDNDRNRMVVFGGDVGGNPSDGGIWVLKRFGGWPEAYNLFDWEQLPGSSLGVSGQTLVTSPYQLGYRLYARQPELFTAGGSPAWTSGPPFARKHQGYYPYMFVLPSGKLFEAGSTTITQILNPTTGTWGSTFTSPLAGASAVMYGPGKIMKCGSASSLESGPTNSAAKIEFDSGDVTSGWSPVGNMQRRRHDLNLTVTPGGKVIATGGTDLSMTHAPPVRGPEIWDPVFGTWTGYGTLAADNADRDYHSVALLLPDARILSAGGWITNPDFTRATVFTPPYLFDPAGKFVDDPAAQASYRRPVITGLPCRVGYGPGAEFEIRTPQAADIAGGGKACLIRPGAVTHAFNQDQRYLPLTIVDCPGGDRLRVTAPAQANLAPPGDYLLFLVSSVGVPSIARWVRVGSTVPWDCTDVTTPAPPSDMWVDLFSDTEAWFVWTAPGDDGTGGPTVSEYDLRGSTQAITDNASLCAGARGSVPPVPGPLSGPGLFQDGAVRGLTPCTLYRFAAKARDDADNWGPISSQVLEQTLCGGGGGGGFQAQPMNPIVTASGSIEREDAGAERETTAGDAQRFGSQGSAQSACAVELSFADGLPAWRSHALSASDAAEAFGSDSAGILVQEPLPGGGWRTIGRRFPAATSAGFAVRGFGRTARYLFRGQHTIQQVGGTVASDRSGEFYTISSARHSRLGDQTTLAAAIGNIPLALAAGDTVSVAYERATEAAAATRGWFLLIGTSGTSTPTARRSPGHRPLAPALPSDFALEANQPNPFARSTTMEFALPRADRVRVEVFDLLGRRVRALIEGDYPAGRHRVTWDARDSDGAAVPAGVYLSRMAVGEFRAQRTLVLLP